jgi:hypothetical protein
VTTLESSSVSFEKYRSQLAQVTIEAVGEKGALLEGKDPLYGPVMVLKNKECLAGALKFSGKKVCESCWRVSAGDTLMGSSGKAKGKKMWNVDLTLLGFLKFSGKKGVAELLESLCR